MASIANAAIWLLDRGIQPVLLHPNSKSPVHTAWNTIRYTKEDIPRVFTDGHNIGINLGAPSNNLIDCDHDTREMILAAPYFLPKTNARFGRPGKADSHVLYFVTHDGPVKRTTFTDTNQKMLGEIRGTGSQTMIPPSIHASKDGTINGPVTWNSDIAAITFETFEYSYLLKRYGMAASAAMYGTLYRTWEGIRHNVMLALAGSLIRNGISRDDTETFCKIVFTLGGEADIRDRMAAIGDTINKWEADPTIETTGLPTLAGYIGDEAVKKLIDWCQLRGTHRQYELTDEGNAERLIDLYGDRIRYNVDEGRWYVWNGRNWEKDHTKDGDSVFHLARAIPRKIAEEAIRTKDDDEMKKLQKWSLNSQNVNRLAAMPRIARTAPEITMRHSQCDTNLMALNVQNGIINLRTGGLEPHDAGQYHTRISPITYDPSAGCPMWLQHLALVTEYHPELLRFFQVFLGYCLTGDTREHVTAILYGPPGTGKTTIIETMGKILGSESNSGYSAQSATSTFMQKQFQSRASDDVARLAGMRFVSASEMEQHQRFATAFIKQLSGGTTLTAAKLYQNQFQFTPQFKLVMDTNEKPRVPADDEAIWQRLLLIPCERRIRDTADDIKGYKETMWQTELPGILNWLIEGCLIWQREGLVRPPILDVTRKEYRDEVDTVAQFIDERCIRIPGARSTARELHTAYVGWCKLNNEHHFSIQRFTNRLKNLGFEFTKPQNKITFHNIRLGYSGDFRAMDDDEPEVTPNETEPPPTRPSPYGDKAIIDPHQKPS